MTAPLDQPHHKPFFEANGLGPWSCYFCGGEVVAGGKGQWAIHHLDGDHTNNVPSNMAPAHQSCHARFHHTGQKRSAEQRAKMRQRALEREANPTQAMLEGKERMREKRKVPWSQARREAYERTVFE